MSSPSSSTSWSSRRREVDHAMARARGAWPDVVVDPESFLAYLDRRGPSAAAPGIVHLDHLYLACACVAGDAAAIARVTAEFVRPLGPLLPGPDQPAGSDEDLRQVVLVHLFFGTESRPPRIAEYTGASDLAIWIRVAAIRVAMGARRRRQAERTAVSQQALLEAGGNMPSAELGMLKDTYRAEFKGAFHRAFLALSERERNLIRLQVVDHLGIDRIGALYGVHRATAARWVARARARLVRGVKHQLRAQLDVGRGELDSILRIIQSQIEISAGAFLSARP